MRDIAFTTPFDYRLSPHSGLTRAHWLELFERLMAPIIDGASPGCARLRLPGQRSRHGVLADEMEGFSRSFIMAGPWLSRSDSGVFTREDRVYDVADFYRHGLIAGTDPGHPEYWGEIGDKAQHLVECASLAWSLYLSRGTIWDTLREQQKSQIAAYLHSCNGAVYCQNNWLLFNVITNTVLKVLGMPFSQEQIDRNIEFCESMYLGDGWFRDGAINRIDYYNAWGFHYYYLMWVLLDGGSKPDRAAAFRSRMEEFGRGFRYFFDKDGSTPCFGRSMIYRFGFVGPLVLAHRLGCAGVSVGELRTMCNGALRFFCGQEILTEAGHLSLGYTRPCDAVVEHYSCGGSPYWAVKALNALALPEDDPFWMHTESPLPIHGEDFSVALRPAGLLLVGNRRAGHVQLINQKSYHNDPSYNAKYTNFAYSSLFSYDARAVYGSFSCDNALCFSRDNVTFRQRCEMENLYCVPGFAASRYRLTGVDEGGEVHTSIVVKDGFLLNIHRVRCTIPLFLREGGYALGYDCGTPELQSAPGGEVARCEGRFSFIRSLHGWQDQIPARPHCGQPSGVNARYHFSIVPALQAALEHPGDYVLVSLVYSGTEQIPLPQLMSLVRSCSRDGDLLHVTWYDGEESIVQTGKVRCFRTVLAGVEIEGCVVCSRVWPDGRTQILYEDGTEQVTDPGQTRRAGSLTENRG